MWRALGCVLPRSIREGVYEPAYLDLWRSVAVGRGRVGGWRSLLTWVRLIGYLLAALWYGFPRYFRGWGRTPLMRWTTRVTMVVVAFGALAILLVAWIMAQFGYAY